MADSMEDHEVVQALGSQQPDRCKRKTTDDVDEYRAKDLFVEAYAKFQMSHDVVEELLGRVSAVEKKLQDVWSETWCELLVDVVWKKTSQAFAPQALVTTVETLGTQVLTLRESLSALQKSTLKVQDRVAALMQTARRAGFAVT